MTKVLCRYFEILSKKMLKCKKEKNNFKVVIYITPTFKRQNQRTLYFLKIFKKSKKNLQ